VRKITELSEVLQTIERLDNTLTRAREVLHDARQVPPESEMHLPDPKSIKSFYEDYTMFKVAIMTVEKDTLTLSTQSQSITLSLLGLLELLSNNFKLPVVGVQQQNITSKPPFVSDMDAIVKNKMEWIYIEFNRILAVDDPRISKLCQDYYRVQSYPLFVRIAYLEWERQFIGYLMSLAQTKLEDTKSLEIREIRKQYGEKLDKEKSALNLRISNMGNELQRLRTVNDRLDGFYQNALSENTGLKNEIEAIHDKMKGNEELVTRQTEENSALKSENEILKNKLNKYESPEWKSDFASTNETPVFCNIKDNTIVTFPCSMMDFRRDYKLKSTDGQKRIYGTENGDKFEIPDSLALKLPSMIQQQQQPTGANENGEPNMISLNGKNVKVSEGAKVVYDLLKESDIPLSLGEIGEETGYQPSNISGRHFKTLRELEVLEETYDNGIKKFSIIDQEGD
jgi:hypothetical protein